MTIDSSAKGPNGQIILFGDSITEGAFETGSCFSYGAALSHVFKRRLDVINRGFSGYNTSHAAVVFPRFMPTPAQAKVELLIICFGANDSCLPHDPTGHHVSLSNFRDNLLSIITSPELTAHKPRIILVTPPPVDEYMQATADAARGFDPLRRNAENTGNYAQVCRDLGAQLHLPVVDIWTSFQQHAGWIVGKHPLPGSRKTPVNEVLQSFLTDGLHLTSLGYKLMYEEVFKSIKANYPEMDPERLPYRYLPWEKAPKTGGKGTRHAASWDNVKGR